jgi:hypothetical protein
LTIFRVVLLIGVVNPFADLTCERARSVTGPFLAQLGATAAIVSIVSGAAEFLGYALRAVAGNIADRTGRYRTLTFIGYAINLLAVPVLALAGNWPVAAACIAAERTDGPFVARLCRACFHVRRTMSGADAFGIDESLDALGAACQASQSIMALHCPQRQRAGSGLWSAGPAEVRIDATETPSACRTRRGLCQAAFCSSKTNTRCASRLAIAFAKRGTLSRLQPTELTALRRRRSCRLISSSSM